MVGDMELQREWLGTIFLVVGLTEIACLQHLAEYDITTVATPVGVSDGVII